ncbi:hypothetical protein [Tsuneonella amylolytica]|uniref:hypothetical protein n=1 Tax=Tsuneonella amylolytica TaxID=2338327 RepID=UPI0013C40928|nr:hypothetical protein [Tsuneonella amylolytica]
MNDMSKNAVSPRALIIACLIVGFVLAAFYGGYVVGRDIARTENERDAAETLAE